MLQETLCCARKHRKLNAWIKKTLRLLDDMAETMYAANGVGLAAPQIGVLKRIVVIDVGEGLIELINLLLLTVRVLPLGRKAVFPYLITKAK